MSIESFLIITNILSFITSLSVIYLHSWSLNRFSRNERTLIQAILSKNIQEFDKSQVTTSGIEKGSASEDDKKPEFISETELSDEDWFKNLEKGEK